MNHNDNHQPPYHSSQQPQGYGYDGYSYGQAESQTFRDFMLVLREKLWYFILAFLGALTCSVVYCYKAVPIYESTVMVQVLRDDLSVLGVKSIESTDIRSVKDLNTQVKIIESLQIIDKVASELTGEDLDAFMAPYREQNELLGPLSVNSVLSQNRKVIPMRTSLMVAIEYEHPDPRIAARVANLFAEKFIEYKIQLDMENSMKAVDDLKVRVDQQRLKVEAIEVKMTAYREDHQSISLEHQADIDHKALTDINSSLTAIRIAYDQAKGKKDLVDKYKKENKDLANLPFISGNPQVRALTLEQSAKNIEVNTYAKRYGKKHPKMIAALRARDQVEHEIENAIIAAEQQVNNDYIEKRRSYSTAAGRLKGKEEDIIALSKLRVEYNSLVRDLEVNQGLYQSLVLRMNTEIAQIDLVKPNARIIDRASAPAFPVKPRMIIIIGGGVVGGVLLGIFLVLLMAYLDDRTRTSYDIESVIGLPLLGVVPRLRRGNSANKALTVSNSTDRAVLESFRAIHSALSINSSGKNAKVMICTSTQPSEGKTFFSINFASTFVQHDEKTIIIDADLRMPRIGALLGKEGSKGVIQYCEDGAPLASVIYQDPITNLHIIPSGGRSSSPTRILSSKQFVEMIDELRMQYDRIIIDSPPLGAVSDALNMLNCVDGLVYVIKFNNTNRRAVKRNIARISDSQTPIIGAVINQVSASMSDYYYNTYYTSDYVQTTPKEKPRKAA